MNLGCRDDCCRYPCAYRDLDKEPDATLYAEAIAEADTPLLSAATLLELHIVILNRHGGRAAQIVDRFKMLPFRLKTLPLNMSSSRVKLMLVMAKE